MCVCVCVCLCVCVCVCERERERERVGGWVGGWVGGRVRVCANARESVQREGSKGRALIELRERDLWSLRRYHCPAPIRGRGEREKREESE